MIAEAKRKVSQQYRKLSGEAFDDMLTSRNATETYLASSNPTLRWVALWLLEEHWPLNDNVAAICESIVANEVDHRIRRQAISYIAHFYAGTYNESIGKILAEVVTSTSNPRGVRLTAYLSLFTLVGIEVAQCHSPRLLSEFPIGVDWEFVERFLRGLPLDKEQYPESWIIRSSALPGLMRDAASRYMNGLDAFEKGEYEISKAHFAELIYKGQAVALGYYMRGCCAGNLGTLDAAIQDLSKAIEVNPKYAHAYFERSEAYARKGLSVLAAEDKRKALSLDPTLAEAEKLVEDP